MRKPDVEHPILFMVTTRCVPPNRVPPLQTCEPMIQAYKYGSLTRIPEFGDFRERLERSVHFATVTAEQMLLELTHTVSGGVECVMVCLRVHAGEQV